MTSLLIAVLIGVAAASEAETPKLLKIEDKADLNTILPELAEKRVVFIGENHDDYAHHRNQLEIISGIFGRHRKLAIGMEMFHRADQKYLDAYTSGAIDEQALIANTSLARRWRAGFRHYLPILRFARQHELTVVGLNLPDSVINEVRRNGIKGLSPWERTKLPEIDRGDADYTQRLKRVFDHHPRANGEDFERFVDVQLLWDEGMAERAAEYLRAHPAGRLIVLAGNQHLAYGAGIPSRLARRMKVDYAIVLQGETIEQKPGIGDYVLISPKLTPPSVESH